MHAPLLLCAALVAVAPSDPATLTLGELVRRLPDVGVESLWNRTTRAFDRDPHAVEFGVRLDAGAQPTDGQWEAALLRAGAVRWHAKWPVGEPFAISIRRPSWLRNGRIDLTGGPSRPGAARGPSLVGSECGTCSSRDERRALYQTLAPLPLGPQRLEFRVEIVTAQPARLGEDPDPVMRWRGALSMAVEVVETIDDAMPPVSNEAIDRAVRASLGVAFADWSEQRTAIVVLDPDFAVHPELADVALSLEIAVVHGDDVVATRLLRASDYDRVELGSSVSTARAKSIAFAAFGAIPRELESDEARRAGWRLRVTGTSDGVLRNWAATRRYAGRFEMPLDEAIRGERQRGASRRRSWGWMPGQR